MSVLVLGIVSRFLRGVERHSVRPLRARGRLRRRRGRRHVLLRGYPRASLRGGRRERARSGKAEGERVRELGQGASGDRRSLRLGPAEPSFAGEVVEDAEISAERHCRVHQGAFQPGEAYAYM